MLKQHGLTYGFAALCVIALPAHATVYVSGGSDSNPCTISQPCREIAHALTVAAAGGEIVVSAAGDFQPIIVSKGVSIVAPAGIHAGITSSTAVAVAVTAGTTDNIVISGLDLSSAGASGMITVQVTSGWVTIDHCLVRDTKEGIDNEDPTGRVHIKDTFITTDNGLGVVAQNGLTLIENTTIQTGGGSGGGVAVVE